MDDVQLETLRRLPSAETCRLLDFDRAEILTLESFPPQFVLAVSGTAPVFNLRVELVPRIYIRQPEYWGIEVAGCLSGTIFLPAQRPFSVTLGLSGVTGTRGVEVIGATRSEELDVPPKEGPLGAFSLSITSKAGDPIANAWLTCSPDGGTHPRAGAACRQLAEADGHIAAIPEDPGVCTDEFNPVILDATGTWGGEPRSFCREYSNLCEGVRATGGVLFTSPIRLPTRAGRSRGVRPAECAHRIGPPTGPSAHLIRLPLKDGGPDTGAEQVSLPARIFSREVYQAGRSTTLVCVSGLAHLAPNNGGVTGASQRGLAPVACTPVRLAATQRSTCACFQHLAWGFQAIAVYQ